LHSFGGKGPCAVVVGGGERGEGLYNVTHSHIIYSLEWKIKKVFPVNT